MTQTPRSISTHEMRQFYPKTCSDLSKNKQIRSNKRKFTYQKRASGVHPAFAQKKRRLHPTSVTSIITSNIGIHYVELSILFPLLPFQVNIFAKADDLQNQIQPLEDFAKRLKPKVFSK
ncbi:unnamed protein product [Brassica rapa]|uniref:Uncharacterized protein n=1 Tax=Brassica campestris TaxID=3711 RepID=A0A8D9CSK7_BRACM|nr:unnamed protein product [Brassica rapa]